MNSVDYDDILIHLDYIEQNEIQGIYFENSTFNTFAFIQHLQKERLEMLLKEPQNCIIDVICVWSLFCSILVYTSLHFPPFRLRK